MEISYFILEVINLLDKTYGSWDVREPPSADRRAKRDLMMVEGGNTLIVAVVTEFVWKQPTFQFEWQVQGFTVRVAESIREWN